MRKLVKMFRYISAMAVVTVLLFASGCGTSSSSPEASLPDNGADASPTHKVPSWIHGTWHIVRLKFGYNVSGMDMMLTVSGEAFDYYYPGCQVHGILSMDADTPSWAGNYYEMIMTRTECSNEWDIPTSDDATDNGHIWSEDDGRSFYRISDIYPGWVWIYQNIEYFPTRMRDGYTTPYY